MVARFVDILNMYKADIAATLGNDASLTGVIHSGGSFALQQEKEAKERRGYRWLVKKLVSGPFSAQIMRPMLALNFPDDEELFAPRLTPGDVTAKDVSLWTASLLSAAAAPGPSGEPLLYDTGPIGKAIRREHGLPEDLEAVEKGADLADGDELTEDEELAEDEELVEDQDAAEAEDDAPLVPVVPLASSAPLMTVKETAQYLRASPSTIRKWSKSGALPIAGQKGKKGGYLYRIEDLVEWLQAPSSPQDDDDAEADAIDTQGAAL
jgi:excisionase family DNA binding protein